MVPANKRIGNAGGFFESLEPRRLFAEAFSLFPDPHAMIGPVYVPTPRLPQAASGATIVRKLVSTQSDAVSLIDITLKDNHPQLERGYWTSPTVWSNSGSFDDSQARVEEIARTVVQGGKDRWRKENVRPNAFTLLDFEGKNFSSRTSEYLAQRVKWFKVIAPDAPVSAYGYPITGNLASRDKLASPTSAFYTQLKADFATMRSLVNELSVMTIDCYMLGPSVVDRDVKAMATLSKAFREVYPGKPVVAIVWGAYHTTWNKAHSILSDAATQKYIDAIRTWFDGAAVWGPAEDNVKMLTLLSDPKNRVRLAAPKGIIVADRPSGSVTGTGTDVTPIIDEIQI